MLLQEIQMAIRKNLNSIKTFWNDGIYQNFSYKWKGPIKEVQEKSSSLYK
tara:strand:- start:2278 stop:2427 length:150 start_codon:yes stop_codon:yes gene_type:complete